MKFTDYNPIIAALGWTLLHSLWQGMLIWLLAVGARRLSGNVSAASRYSFSTAWLALIVISSVVTFSYIFNNEGIPPSQQASGSFISLPSHTAENFIAPLSPMAPVITWINRHLSFFVMLWVGGVFLFGIRLSTAWLASARLQKMAQPVPSFWRGRLTELAAEIGVRGKVVLAHCKSVTSPVVLGYLKPVILLPFGMLTNLTTEQIEAILLHELVHIRRHDYLVNILQSFAEVIFFFNPFVWLLSSTVRGDRELCCDDVVVSLKNPLAYASALHKLEEERAWSTNTSLVVAALGQKNQLLHRIRRIMETPQKTNQKSRLRYPAVIIIITLFVASWISAQAYWSDDRGPVAFDKSDSPSDTTIKDKPKSKVYIRKSITTIDAEGKPHEEVTEETSDADFTELPTPPDLNFVLPDAPELPSELQNLFVEMNSDFSMLTDTIPDAFSYSRHNDWEQFGKEFSEKFQQKFGDFYKKNGPELEKMMQELQTKMKMQGGDLNELMARAAEMKLLAMRDAAGRDGDLERRDGEILREQQELQRQNESLAREMNENSLRDANRDRNSDEQLRLLQGEAHRDYALAEEQYREFANELAKIKSDQDKVALPELRKDGYLGKDEQINTVNITEDEVMINGKKIKAKDRAKYKNLFSRPLNSKEKRKVLHVE